MRSPVDPGLRVGFGVDTHPYQDGRALVLGGVSIPHTKGLAGHSDADALLHSIADALLGAAGAGDIGTLFPATDERYKGARSEAFVQGALDETRARGYCLVNLDATLVAEEPILAPHMGTMRESVARLLGVAASRVNLRAKRAEGMGAIGRGEGVVAMSCVLLARIEEIEKE